MEVAVGLGFCGVGEHLRDFRRRKRMKQRLGVASWHSGKATEMDADDQLEADWGTFKKSTPVSGKLGLRPGGWRW